MYFGLVGYPVKHSVSPAMHNAAFKQLGIDAVYLAFEVKPNEVDKAIFGAKALGFKGLNITIPHKEKALEFVKPDSLAARIGAINTIDLETMKGYNTDAYGALKALESSRVNVEGKNILIVGAGGAARAIAFALIEKSLVVISNRTEQRGLKLVEELRRYGESIFIPYNEIEKLEGKIDVIVNATPLGMKGFESKPPLPHSLIRDVVVFDTVYNPMETELIKLARKRKCKVVYGIDMLVYQGAKAFEIWTGKKAPVEVMKKAAINSLTLNSTSFISTSTNGHFPPLS
ncbi:shikimate dehydrogenase [Archaeoglobales archaeon]|nr:MAG: shikimate dehydrogenase [Archaeoglobales archaeon]